MTVGVFNLTSVLISSYAIQYYFKYSLYFLVPVSSLVYLFLQINKPLMEKKRRARINSCLGQLKSLVLEAMKKDVSISIILLCLIYITNGMFKAESHDV